MWKWVVTWNGFVKIAKGSLDLITHIWMAYGQLNPWAPWKSQIQRIFFRASNKTQCQWHTSEKLASWTVNLISYTGTCEIALYQSLKKIYRLYSCAQRNHHCKKYMVPMGKKTSQYPPAFISGQSAYPSIFCKFSINLKGLRACSCIIIFKAAKLILSCSAWT